MIKTGWLDSALGPGGEDDEACERFNIKTVYRSIPSAPGFEVTLFGDYQDVAKAVVEWWASGDDAGDIEYLQHAVSTFTVVDDAEQARMSADLADAKTRVEDIQEALLDAKATLILLEKQAEMLGL